MTRTRRTRPGKQTATNTVVLADDSIDLDKLDALLCKRTREERELEARFRPKEAKGRRKNDEDVHDSEIEESSVDDDSQSSYDSEPKRELPKSKTPPKESKRKSTDITTVSSNDSSSNKRREQRRSSKGGGKQSPSLKEQSRIDAANGVKAQTDSIKTIADQKKTIDRLRAKSDQDRVEIKGLSAELEDMTQKHNELEHELGKLEKDNEKLKAAFMHIRNNPDKFAKQVAGGPGGPKRKTSRNKIKKDLEKHADQCPEVQSGILTTSKEVVKTIYRVFKFINTDEQQQMFLDLMLDNLGLLAWTKMANRR